VLETEVFFIGRGRASDADRHVVRGSEKSPAAKSPRQKPGAAVTSQIAADSHNCMIAKFL